MTEPTPTPVTSVAQSIEALREIVATLKELEAPYIVNVYISTVPLSRTQTHNSHNHRKPAPESLF